MCGISGYVGNFSPSLIEDMNLALTHRGPDYSDSLFINNCVLGHTRLSIIDLSSRSSQPMVSHCNRYIITFNGEIYNFNSLRDGLIKQGFTFNTKGDTEVLLTLWSLYGTDSLLLLDGIFAFAVYDKLERTLFVVRDQFGVKPLYYSITNDGFLFSSEIKALLQYKELSREVSIDAVAKILTFMWVPGSQTMLKSVSKVMPGQVLIIDSESNINSFFYPKETSISLCEDLNKNITSTLSAMTESVNSQLVSDVEIGAMLSGGVDSSLICSLAKSKSSSFRKCYTIDFEDNKGIDSPDKDLPFAQEVAKLLGLDLSVTKLDSSIISYLPLIIYYLDEPNSDPAIINSYILCRAAKRDGLKVLFSGAGGDDFYTGYRRHLALFYADKFSKLSSFLSFFTRSGSLFFSRNSSIKRKLIKFSRILSVKGDESLMKSFSWCEPSVVKSLFSDSVSILDVDPYDVFKRRLQGLEQSLAEKALVLDREFFLVDHNLNYTDKMGMANGVEVRVPFVSLHHYLNSLSIPFRNKIYNGQLKYVLKRVASKYLPSSIVYRKKTGFGAPLREWVHGPLRPLIDDILSVESIKSRGLFDPIMVRNLIDQDSQGIEDYSYTIYALISIEIWFRIFIDNPVPVKPDNTLAF